MREWLEEFIPMPLRISQDIITVARFYKLNPAAKIF